MKYFKIIMASAILCAISACHTAPEKPPYAGIKLGKPYEIYGRWYKPHYDKDYDEIGVASWYGPGFHGGKTANGEKYDQMALTGAHRTLPMPSIVRVTNLNNGMSALVKINDRGPFAHDRIIDLSKAAAIQLGVIRTGTAKVRVQFLERETKEYVDNLTNGTHYAMNTLKQVDPTEAAVHEEQRQVQLATGNAEPAPEGAVEVVNLPATTDGTAINPPKSSPFVQSPPPVTANNAHPAANSAPADIFTSAEYLNAQAADNAQPVNNNSGRIVSAAVPAATTIPPSAASNGVSVAVNYMVQAGTFGMETNANHLRDRLISEGHAQVQQVNINNRNFYRVVMGPYNMQSDAKNILSKLTAMGISDAKIIRN